MQWLLIKVFNLVLLLSSALTVYATDSYFMCGENSIKSNLAIAMAKEGCSRYKNEQICSGVSCFRVNRLPMSYIGNHFPENQHHKFMWPIRRRNYMRSIIVGYALIGISSNDDCDFIGVLYQLKDTSLSRCEGPIPKNPYLKYDNAQDSRIDVDSRSTSSSPSHETSGYIQTPGGTYIIKTKKKRDS